MAETGQWFISNNNPGALVWACELDDGILTCGRLIASFETWGDAVRCMDAINAAVTREAAK